MRMLAQVSFQHANGLSKDRYVNTFHFGAIGDFVNAANANAAIAQIRDFYEEQVNLGVGPVSVGQYLSPRLLRPYTIKVYDMGKPEPREPIVTGAGTLRAPLDNGSAPFEVALCLSFYAGLNSPRRRGRIYLGPLGAAAVDTSGGADPRPQFPFLEVVRARAAILAAEDEPLAEWSVHSTKAGEPATRPVTAGWVDDALDTVRKRGIAASSRLTFAV